MVRHWKSVKFVACLLIGLIHLGRASRCPEVLRLVCHEQTTCGNCMLAHSCCHWCYNLTLPVGTYRCDFKESLSQCGPNIQDNKGTSQILRKNWDFTEINKAKDATGAIQLKPQAFDVILRKDSMINLTFAYRAVKNYPLELYFLGDLSYSMKSHLETLKNLGSSLGNSLEQLTKHYRLAYGSFLDKPGMPFIWTDKLKYENPCRPDGGTCEKTYLFKHNLNFTVDTSQFFEQVKNSKISANVDDSDGALEAIHQILVCDKKFGWSEYSRKIILLSTDSLLHTEGDGLLAGATKVNIKDVCLVNSAGDHVAPLEYDYPSLGQIKRLLRSYRVNLIVAVTREKIKQYQRMEKDILEQEAFVGVLEQNSQNILDLVEAGFYDFIRQVEFFANTSHAPELQVKFFADCEGQGQFVESSGCKNVQEGVPITFIMQLGLNQEPNKYNERIFIKEKNIKEDIGINIEYISGTCECPNYVKQGEIGCEHGKIDCGTCVCDLGWKGDNCSEECIEDQRACRQDAESLSCSGRGDCLCGKCTCQYPFMGNFCQFECPISKSGQICSEKGLCHEGLCACYEGYSHDDCSCDNNNDECTLGGKICNDNGKCECNQCICQKGHSGKYCEVESMRNFLCDKYDDLVKEHVIQNKTNNFLIHTGEENVVLMESKDAKCETNDHCSIMYDGGAGARCFIDYCYKKGANDSIHLATMNQKCIYTAQAMGLGVAFIVFGLIILIGLLAICIKKIQLSAQERAEFKKFEAASKVLCEMNPLYVSPVSEYTNPMARKNN